MGGGGAAALAETVGEKGADIVAARIGEDAARVAQGEEVVRHGAPRTLVVAADAVGEDDAVVEKRALHGEGARGDSGVAHVGPLLIDVGGGDAGGVGRRERSVGVDDGVAVELAAGIADFAVGRFVVVAEKHFVGGIDDLTGGADGGERRGVVDTVIGAVALVVHLFDEDGRAVSAEVAEPLGRLAREVEFVGGHGAFAEARARRDDQRGLRFGVEFADVGIGRAGGELLIDVDVERVATAFETVDGENIAEDAVHGGFDEEVLRQLLLDKKGVNFVVGFAEGNGAVGVGEDGVKGGIEERALGARGGVPVRVVGDDALTGVDPAHRWNLDAGGGELGGDDTGQRVVGNAGAGGFGAGVGEGREELPAGGEPR